MRSIENRNARFVQRYSVMQKPSLNSSQSGFSLIELLIAMSVSVVLMGLASVLLAGSFNIRARENQRTEAIADAQRGLNLMTREIANSGYGLGDNGIVLPDSSNTSIRVRANLNAAAGETTSNAASDRDEDIRFMLFNDSGSSYIVCLDVNVGAQEMVLANRVDSFKIRYYADKVFYTAGICDIGGVRDAAGNTVNEAAKSSAKYVVISVCVTLPAVGTPGSP